MNITVYTCLIGYRDELRAPAIINPNVRYLCFSDRPRQCAPWEIQPIQLDRSLTVQRNSRKAKHLPHTFFESDYSLWIDGTLGINIDPEQMLPDWLSSTDLALYCHPNRHDVWEERDFCRQYHYGDPVEVESQVLGYRTEGMMPSNSGLWSGGVIARRHTPSVTAWNESLWAAYSAGSCRDQLAIPYAIWKTGIRVTTIGHGWHLGPGYNPWFPFYRHDEEAIDGRRPSELCFPST